MTPTAARKPAGRRRQNRRAAGRHPAERGWPGTHAQEVADLVARIRRPTEATGLLPGPRAQGRRRTPGRALGQAVPEACRPTRPRCRKPCSKPKNRRGPRRPRGARRARRSAATRWRASCLRLGAEPWQARAMTDAAATIFAGRRPAAGPGGARHVGALGDAGQSGRAGALQRFRRGPRSQGHRRRATPPASTWPARRRSMSASSEPPSSMTISRRPPASTRACTTPPSGRACRADVILQILKIHAYETDFRQRVRAGDGFEFFFDVKDEDKGIEGGLGELLATSVTVERRDAQVLPLPHARRGTSTTTTSRATPRASS